MKPLPTPEEALVMIKKKREYQRVYAKTPKAREKQRKYRSKVFAGYAAAKKAGLI